MKMRILIGVGIAVLVIIIVGTSPRPCACRHAGERALTCGWQCQSSSRRSEMYRTTRQPPPLGPSDPPSPPPLPPSRPTPLPLRLLPRPRDRSLHHRPTRRACTPDPPPFALLSGQCDICSPVAVVAGAQEELNSFALFSSSASVSSRSAPLPVRPCFARQLALTRRRSWMQSSAV